MRNIVLLFVLLLTSCQFTSSKKENLDKLESKKPQTDTITISEGEFALSEDSESTAIFFTGPEDMPEFPGGDAALIDFIINHTVYPASAIRDRVEGRVYVQFAIEKDGSVSVLGIRRGVRQDLDDAAMAVARQMPVWKPGKFDGELRRIIFTIPVYYSLEDLEAGKIRAEEARTVKIYPNPTSDRATMEISELIPDLLYGVYDKNGRMVKQGPMTSRRETIDFSGLSNGTYIVRLSSAEESFMYSERVVKK
jgi:TonB family protein